MFGYFVLFWQFFVDLFGFLLAGDHQKIDVFHLQQTLVRGGRVANGCTFLSELSFALFLLQEFRKLTKLLHEHFNSFYVIYEYNQLFDHIVQCSLGFSNIFETLEN